MKVQEALELGLYMEIAPALFQNAWCREAGGAFSVQAIGEGLCTQERFRRVNSRKCLQGSGIPSRHMWKTGEAAGILSTFLFWGTKCRKCHGYRCQQNSTSRYERGKSICPEVFS